MTDRFALIVDGQEVARFLTQWQAAFDVVTRGLASREFTTRGAVLFFRPGVTIEPIEDDHAAK